MHAISLLALIVTPILLLAVIGVWMAAAGDRLTDWKLRMELENAERLRARRRSN